ncbi:MAG: SurA N-terminal domain-containing protein [Gammaproteobacteria bacterium]
MMMQLIRNMVTGWLAVVIVALLIIPFAFWGINYYFEQGANIVAAEVNDSKISLQEYQRTYQRVRQQWQDRGADITDQEDLIKQQTIDSLVNLELLSQFRKEMGLRVNDQQVRQALMDIEIFQSERGFDTSLYSRYLAAAGYTPAAFEAQVREDMTAEQLQAGIIESSFITGPEVERIARLNNQTRDIRYLFVSFDEIAEGIEITEEEIKDWYDKQDAEYMEPEKVRIAYIELSREQIAADVPVSEPDLESYFRNNKANYSIEEQRKVRQILFGLGDDPSPERIEAIEAAAMDVLAEIESGKSFNDVAGDIAENPEQNIEVSEFGYLSRGILDSAVEEVVFSLDEGSVGGPVRSDAGIHLVQVEDIRGGEESTFQQVREQVEEDYRDSQAERQFFDYAERLATLAFEHPDTLEIAAEDLGIPVQQSEYFSREGAGDGFLNDPKVLSAAFSDEVLRNGNNSEIIELGTNRSIVLRVIDHKLPAKQPLEEVRDEVVEAIRFEKGSNRTREIGQLVIQELKAGNDGDAVAGQYDLKWKSAAGVKRDDPAVNRSILRTAFSLGRPDNGPLIGGDALGSGDYAVVVVNAVHDAQSLAADDVRPVRQELERMQAITAFRQFLETLKADADIRIRRDNL